MTRWSALLLAGSRPPGPTGKKGDALFLGHKALMPVGGKPMFLQPLQALLDSEQIGQICVLTQQPELLRPVLPDDPRVEIRQSLATIAATIAGLIESGELRYPVLVTTADHALLDPAMIAEFTAAAAGADLAIGLVERRNLLARFPQSKRTWIGFKGGRYSGANLFAFGSDKVVPAIDRWRSVEVDRKKGWRLLTAFGPAMLMGAVLKLRTIEQSAQSVGRRLGMIIRPVILSDPKAAIDVDKPADLELVEAILAGPG